ncbi:hypothetical protein D8Y22_08355 [Salinadaptatus halalkaliphilus]|uniref:DUF1102 domain-containing protein n=1 Tax=Salinadaptatus halalkaliphilus TaxID=2419781 RepID=A0A4S3TPU1_9EURY|nr:hypothetical protein [Salinadaptatus halalkaliphilus]THE65215.1 hypothetical protein D8Y22_08355 [Salinadaptatus halalkaliphilus]
MNRRAFLGLGAAFIGAGALHQTGAFSSVSAGRGVAVSAATDPNALLGVDRSEYPPTVTNNTDSFSMTVSLESHNLAFDVTGDGSYEEPATFQFGPGDSRTVELEGDDDTVTITAELENGAGTIELERFFEVPQAAAIEQVVGSVREAFGSGRYEFSLTNTSGNDITLDGFGIAWTNNPDAMQVPRPNGNDSILTANGSQRIDQVLYVGGEITDVIDGQEVQLGGGEAMDFEIQRFSDGNPGGGIGVEDVDLAVRAADGSSSVVELRADG